jgi:hypothetical protein
VTTSAFAPDPFTSCGSKVLAYHTSAPDTQEELSV